MPRASRVQVPTGRQTEPPATAGEPGRRRYGCQPNDDRHRPTPGRHDRRVDTRARASRAIAVTSMRCGNGNAGASTIDRRTQPSRVGPRRRAARPSSPAGRRATRGSAARCRRPAEGRPSRSTVTPAARYRHAESRFAHGASRGRPVVRPARSASSPPGRARCSTPLHVATRRRSFRVAA